MGTIYFLVDDARREYLYCGKASEIVALIEAGPASEDAFLIRAEAERGGASWASLQWSLTLAIAAWRFCERAEWKVRVVNDAGNDPLPDEEEGWTEWTVTTWLLALLRRETTPSKVVKALGQE